MDWIADLSLYILSIHYTSNYWKIYRINILILLSFVYRIVICLISKIKFIDTLSVDLICIRYDERYWIKRGLLFDDQSFLWLEDTERFN
jgi:hypothetical protein